MLLPPSRPRAHLALAGARKPLESPAVPGRRRSPPRGVPTSPPADTNLGGEILEDGGAVHCGRGTDAPMARRPVLEVPVDTADGELQRK